MFRPSPSSLTLTGTADRPADTDGSVTSNELLGGSRGSARRHKCTCADEMETEHGGAGRTRRLGGDSNFSHNIEIGPHLKEVLSQVCLTWGNNGEHDVHGQFIRNAVHRDFC